MRCPMCGCEMGEIQSCDLIHDPILRGIFASMREKVVCDECARKADEREMQEQRRERMRNVMEEMPLRGFPPSFVEVRVPYVPGVARWLYDRAASNIILSGESGTGKTSGAVAACKQMEISHGCLTRYYEMQDMLNEFRMYKRGERGGESTVRFFKRLGSEYDIIVIDELIGKGRATEMTGEFLFALFDAIYNGYMDGKVWLLGNFYRGALRQVIPDYAPALRRIKAKFTFGVAENSTVTEEEMR